MNLLIFILSLIMMLSVMTYSRLENFTKNHIQAQEWRWIMKESERDVYNRRQAQCNAEINKTNKTNKDNPTPPPSEEQKKEESANPLPEGKTETQKNGSGKISLAWLLNKDLREKKADAFQNMSTIIQTMIVEAWGNQPFYKKLDQERPGFVKLMLQDMVESVEKYKATDKRKKVSTLDDLLFISWSDLSLKEAYGRMLQESLIYDRSQDKTKPAEGRGVSPKGFQSLRDYFEFKENDKIRLWLASRPVLMALFSDEQIVNNIIDTRTEYYREIRNNNTPTAELSKKFQENFSPQTPYNELIDYKITKTNPNR